jgi:hypothetical protein
MSVFPISVFQNLRSFVCLVLAGLLLVGTPVHADGPAEIRAKDVVLADSGMLSGTVLNNTAQRVSDVAIQILHENKVVASTTSRADGRFAVRGLRNGAHVIQVAGVQQPIRLWGHDAAPPTALSQLAVVVPDDVVRGQAGLVPFVAPGFYNSTSAAFLVIGAGVGATLGTTLTADHYNDRNGQGQIQIASP